MTRRGLAGTDGSGGLIVPSYVEWPLLGAAPAVPAAGKARAYLDSNGALQLLPAAGILGRRVAVHWGTVTAWPALAAAGDTCVRSDIGTAGSLWQYTGIASSGAAGWVTESPVVCTSGTRPTGAVLYDGLAIFQTDDKATATWDVANTIWHVTDSITQTYNPTLTTTAGIPGIGNGSLVGRYRRQGRLCWLFIQLASGTTTNMGSGAISFSLPPGCAASAGEQWIPAGAWTGSGGLFGGFALVSSSTVAPWLPANNTNSSLGGAQSANAAGTIGTGVPAVTSHYTFESGTNLHVQGTYEMTAG